MFNKFLVLFAFIITFNTIKANDLNKRLDCYLENDFEPNKTSCEERGCIWDPNSKYEGIPECYLNTDKIGYNLVAKPIETENGFKAELKLKETAKNLLKYLPQIDRLKLEVIYLTENILRFKITDPKNKRYEVPIQNTFPLLQQKLTKIDKKSQKYKIEFNENQTDFKFAINRKDSKTRIFDTSIGGLIFSDQLLQIATYLPTNNIYGFGENTHHSLKHDLNYKTWNMFARGIGPDTGVINLYGVHPFYTGLESDGKSHGVLLLNSNAMEYTLLPEPALSLKTTGGILDFFVFVGDNPEHVIQLYTSLIGRPFLPPFWGLGFQLTRYGFKNTENVREVIDRNLKAKVPLDVFYVDIDYMSEYTDFTYDNKSFADLPKLMAKTKSEHNLHWNLILDPAIEGNNTEYTPFRDGYKNDIFIKWPKSVNQSERNNPKDAPTDKDTFYGSVWPRGPSAFPDFFKNATQKWWQKWIKQMYIDLDLKFDALWIDMNEPYNFNTVCPYSKYDEPDVRIQSIWGAANYTALSNETLCMVLVQGENSEYIHYNVHSLYALTESIATQKAVREVTGKRGYILSRSTYVSSGRYTAHWLGDNTSKWSQMRDSIIGVLEFNLFGLNFVGADICGFFHNSTAELCRRWSQLGAFYPFSRNHNELHPRDQDPAVWALRGNPEVTEAAINALNLRYSLLPYLYTLFFKGHTLGQTVARPLFHEFPTDNQTHEIHEQFMWGSSVLISPFLYENQTEVKAYLPQTEVWYQSWPEIRKTDLSGHIRIADKPTGPPPVHLRGGSVIPMSSKSKHTNTESVRNSGISLVVIPNKDRTASGDLFWDDGEGIDTIESAKYNYFTFEKLSDCRLIINVKQLGYSSAPVVNYIKVYNFYGTGVKAYIDGKNISAKAVDNTGMTRIDVNLNLKSKKVGDKWVINWTDIRDKCNIN